MVAPRKTNGNILPRDVTTEGLFNMPRRKWYPVRPCLQIVKRQKIKGTMNQQTHDGQSKDKG